MHGLDAECDATLNYVTVHCGLKCPKLYQHIDSPLWVLIYQAKVEADKPGAGLAVKPSHHSKVVQYQAPIVCNRNVAWMRICMEDIVTQKHLEEQSMHTHYNLFSVDPFFIQPWNVSYLDAWNIFHCKHMFSSPLQEYVRYYDGQIACQIA